MFNRKDTQILFSCSPQIYYFLSLPFGIILINICIYIHHICYINMYIINHRKIYMNTCMRNKALKMNDVFDRIFQLLQAFVKQCK